MADDEEPDREIATGIEFSASSGQIALRAGCTTTSGWMPFTYDCGEHDQCGRVHGGSINPWDPECGDEYWDADDDLILGVGNCPVP